MLKTSTENKTIWKNKKKINLTKYMTLIRPPKPYTCPNFRY